MSKPKAMRSSAAHAARAMRGQTDNPPFGSGDNKHRKRKRKERPARDAAVKQFMKSRGKDASK